MKKATTAKYLIKFAVSRGATARRDITLGAFYVLLQCTFLDSELHKSVCRKAVVWGQLVGSVGEPSDS